MCNHTIRNIFKSINIMHKNLLICISCIRNKSIWWMPYRKEFTLKMCTKGHFVYDQQKSFIWQNRIWPWNPGISLSVLLLFLFLLKNYKRTSRKKIIYFFFLNSKLLSKLLFKSNQNKTWFVFFCEFCFCFCAERNLWKYIRQLVTSRTVKNKNL